MIRDALLRRVRTPVTAALTIDQNHGLSAQSFHPKTGGARLYADSLERTFTGMGQ